MLIYSFFFTSIIIFSLVALPEFGQDYVGSLHFVRILFFVGSSVLKLGFEVCELFISKYLLGVINIEGKE